MRRAARTLALVLTTCVLVASTLAGCAATEAAVDPADTASSVWAVDLVKTLPGQRDRYLRFNALNWVPMREAFVDAGIARSFRVLTLPPDSLSPDSLPSGSSSPDSGRGWDVMLMTEYVDAAAYARREEVFAEVAARPGHELVRVDGLGPRDLGRIVTSYEMADATTHE